MLKEAKGKAKVRMQNAKLIITVKVTPNAKKNEIVKWEDGILFVRVKGVPEKGKVNEEMVSFLAKQWGIAKRQIVLKSGHTSRMKRIEVEGMSEKEFYSKWK